MTDGEMRWTLSAPPGYQLGHPWTRKEKGRGTLQTSAVPLGYGAVGLENGETTGISQPTALTIVIANSDCWQFLLALPNHSRRPQAAACDRDEATRAIKPSYGAEPARMSHRIGAASAEWVSAPMEISFAPASA